MSITICSEDILPEIQTRVPVSLAAQAEALEPAEHAEATPAIRRDISGCMSLLGPVSICWNINLTIPSVSVSLKVGPVTVFSGEISPERPCLSFKGDYGVAKWDLTVCLRLPQKAITLEGKVCVSLLGCRSFKVTLFQWGADEPATAASSTQITVKNSSDVTVCALIQMGALYGAVALNPGDEGQMPCEWVWYTLDIQRNATRQTLVQQTGVYGGKKLELTGSNGNYKLTYKN